MMSFFRLLMVATLGLSACSAQAQAGTMLLYGSTGIKYSGRQAPDNSFVIAPGIGYQFNNNWTTGIDAAYTRVPRQSEESESLQLGPFIQYFRVLNERFGFFTQGIVGYKRVGHDQGVFATVFPALYVFIGKRWGMYLIPGTIDYSRLRGDTFSFSLNAVPLLGISANIPVSQARTD